MESGHQTLHKYLISQSKLGDRKAQNELYQLYVGAMYNLCRRMMGDPDEAKDVLQDAFIHAFTKISTLKEEALFPAWLKRIVVNHCINTLKKKRIYVQSLSEDQDFEQEVSEGSDVHKKEQIKLILGALDRISPGCRTVLNLYVFEGFDHGEIAQILSISESASKAQYSKAKSKIRQIIEEETN